MKLREVYIRCKRCFDSIDVVTENDFFLSTDNNEKDISFIIYILKQIESIDFLKDNINELKRLLPKKNSLPTIINEKKIKYLLFQEIKQKISIVIDLCEMLGMKDKETVGIDIKLPTNCDLIDLKQYINDLEFIFTKCLFFQDDNEKFKFENMDVGSSWITLSVTGIILLQTVAAFIDKCFIIRSHRLTADQQKFDIEKSKMDQIEKAYLMDSINKLYRFSVDNAISELEEISGKKAQDEEERDRAAQSFEKMVRLMDKGLQIYSTIDTPKDVKVLFEPIETKYISLGNELKLLEKKNKDE